MEARSAFYRPLTLTVHVTGIGYGGISPLPGAIYSLAYACERDCWKAAVAFLESKTPELNRATKTKTMTNLAREVKANASSEMANG